MISIITVNRNNAHGLQMTMQSVLSQTYLDIEYIVVDGASTDNSVEVIDSFSDDTRLRWISEEDNGIYHAMNKGIRMANGKYLIFMNSGDEFYSNDVLKNVVLAISSNSFDIYYGDVNLCYSNRCVVKTYPDKVSKSFLYQNSLCHQAMFLKKELFSKVGLYNENLRIMADWEWTIKAIMNQKQTYKHLSIIIANYKMDGISYTNERLFRDERGKIIKAEFSQCYRFIKRCEKIWQKIIKKILK